MPTSKPLWPQCKQNQRTLRAWRIYQFCWLQVMPDLVHPLKTSWVKPGYFMQVRNSAVMLYRHLLPERWQEERRNAPKPGELGFRPVAQRISTEDPTPERSSLMADDEMSVRLLVTQDSGPSLHLLLLVPRNPAILFGAQEWQELRDNYLPFMAQARLAQKAEAQQQGDLLTNRCACCRSGPAAGSKMHRCTGCSMTYYSVFAPASSNNH